MSAPSLAIVERVVEAMVPLETVFPSALEYDTAPRERAMLPEVASAALAGSSPVSVVADAPSSPSASTPPSATAPDASDSEHGGIVWAS